MQNPSFEFHGRRSFISTLFRSGIATGIGLTAYQAFRQPETAALLESLSSTDIKEAIDLTPEVTDIPEVAIPRPAPKPLPGQKSYGEFIASLELEYISPSEIFAAHRRSRNGVRNALPPKRMWSRLAPTLLIADELRHRLGVPLTYIASAYRSPEYNRQCPGAAKYSQHTQNRALDLVFSCPSKDAFAEARKMRNEGKFSGGLGFYPGFIHIDTRGRNATWGA